MVAKSLGILLLATLFLPRVVNAQITTSQTATTTASPAQVKPLPATNGQLKTLQARKETREEFVQKLSALKDERKKAITDRLNTRLTTSNTNLTERMTKALDKLTEFLAKAASKSAALKTAGKDTTTLDALILKAQSTLSTASAAVAAQGLKSYTFTVTNDATVKFELGTTITQFKQDMTATHKELVNARIAVMNVFAEAMRLTNSEIKISTNSGIIQ